MLLEENGLLTILHIAGFTCVACSVAAVEARNVEEVMLHIGNRFQSIPDVWGSPYTLECNSSDWRGWRNAFQRKEFCLDVSSEFSSEAWLELTTILQLTQLKVLGVGDVLVRGQKEDDVALLVFDRDDIEQTVERASCFAIKNYKSLRSKSLLHFPFFFPSRISSKSIVKKEIARIILKTNAHANVTIDSIE